MILNMFISLFLIKVVWMKATSLKPVQSIAEALGEDFQPLMPHSG